MAQVSFFKSHYIRVLKNAIQNCCKNFIGTEVSGTGVVLILQMAPHTSSKTCTSHILFGDKYGSEWVIPLPPYQRDMLLFDILCLDCFIQWFARTKIAHFHSAMSPVIMSAMHTRPLKCPVDKLFVIVATLRKKLCRLPSLLVIYHEIRTKLPRFILENYLF